MIRVRILLQGGHVYEMTCEEDSILLSDIAAALTSAGSGLGVGVQQLIVESETKRRGLAMPCSAIVAVETDPAVNFPIPSNVTFNPLRPLSPPGSANTFEQAPHDKAATLKPDLAEVWLGRGNVLTALKRHDEAFAAYDKALALKPDLAEAWLGRGNTLTDLKRYDKAVVAYDKALALKPDLAEAWLGRGILKVIRGNVEEGQKDCEQAISFGADQPSVHFHLARYGAVANIHSVPRKLIEDLFNDSASYFDSFLIDTLKYSVPIKLYNLVRQRIKNHNLDVLDLGCGTGLLGAQLRPIARTLVGVDLSYRMLDKAKARAIYDDLQCKDIIEFMNNDTRSYDLVTSADVFVYLGDLSEIFKSVTHRLKAYGWFAFSVEAINEDDYILKDTGRFQHSKAYLERLALNNGFKVHAIEDATLREEKGEEVPGFLALLSLSG